MEPNAEIALSDSGLSPEHLQATGPEEGPEADMELIFRITEQDREILQLRNRLSSLQNQQESIPMEIDHGQETSRKSYRYVTKVPEWKEKIFKKGDDVSEFLALFDRKVKALSGQLTKSQEANFIGTAIDSKVKSILAMYNVTQEVEDPVITKERLRKLFSDKSGVIKNTNINHWSAQFAELKMETHQSWSDYFTVIAKKGEQFQASQQNTGQEALLKIEDRMWEALTHRSNPDIKKCLLRAEDEWENKKEEMMIPGFKFRSAYEYCIRNLSDEIPSYSSRVKITLKEKNQKKPENSPSGGSQSALCRFDGKCTRRECRYTHTQNGTEPAPKKLKISGLCAGCKHYHPGDDCSVCWKCHPDKAPSRK